MDVQFRPLTANRAECGKASAAIAIKWMCCIRRGNVLLGQVVIRQGGAQAAIEKLGLGAHFPLLGTGGWQGFAWQGVACCVYAPESNCAKSISAKVLRIT